MISNIRQTNVRLAKRRGHACLLFLADGAVGRARHILLELDSNRQVSAPARSTTLARSDNERNSRQGKKLPTCQCVASSFSPSLSLPRQRHTQTSHIERCAHAMPFTRRCTRSALAAHAGCGSARHPAPRNRASRSAKCIIYAVQCYLPSGHTARLGRLPAWPTHYTYTQSSPECPYLKHSMRTNPILYTLRTQASRVPSHGGDRARVCPQRGGAVPRGG
jgi:hypothetical protein